ncbi:lipoprotein-releasing ABC transporter permease subunit [Ferruginivarius sediminum]|uniref:Lipoprotein-releasing ABC transporter permease subunit n=1 Tax=Ferruginivarius sediminum TaxID=2661937 RepID=A0A369T9Y4_9PROT|nr:lipoprotein-releasing ABC transporter permease subunit [Ferruginivarius sediminum]RDD62139.1 lipoprotein-releasing ABC transporter permease subunit [Ferruginivarius sediminum]
MIFSAFERTVAFRYLRARRQEGFISVIAGFSLLGIALGVATLIIVMAVMNGFRQELLQRILGVNGHITIYADDGSIEDYEALSEKLRRLGAVTLAQPQVQGQVMVTHAGNASGAVVRGMRAEDLRNRDLVANNLVSGSLDGYNGQSALVGSRLAQKLGLGSGSRLTLVTPRGETTVMGTVPRVKSYPIAGLFQVGMYEYDSSFIYLPLAAAQKFFKHGDTVNAIEVFVRDPDTVDEVRGEIARVLGPGYRTVDWQRANASFFNAIQVERNVMFLILTLIILVAAFNIISGQIMLVKDKGADIAILRTMGATRGMIMRIFLISGASIGVVGTFLGFVLGLTFSLNIETIRQWLQSLTGTELFAAEIYFLSNLPAKVDPNEVVSVVLMALALSLLATLYPSWRAARLDPVEALRYE